MINKMKLNIKSQENIEKLLEILVCPKTGGKLKYDKKRKELIQPIQRKIYKAIESLAEDNNYSFVLDKSKHSNILFADPKYDKSDDIIRKLKK